MENADKVLHKDLALSLRCLARFFWRYPVVIFHTNSTTASEMDWMRSRAIVRELMLKCQNKIYNRNMLLFSKNVEPSRPSS